MRAADLIKTLREYNPDAEVHITNSSLEEVSSILRIGRLDVVQMNGPDRHLVLVADDEPGYVDDLEPSAIGNPKSGGSQGMKRLILMSGTTPVDDMDQSSTESDSSPRHKKKDRRYKNL